MAMVAMAVMLETVESPGQEWYVRRFKYSACCTLPKLTPNPHTMPDKVICTRTIVPSQKFSVKSRNGETSHPFRVFYTAHLRPSADLGSIGDLYITQGGTQIFWKKLGRMESQPPGGRWEGTTFKFLIPCIQAWSSKRALSPVPPLVSKGS
ncbi:hypothetical protein BDZ97DRAFT_1918961 [Flammula alnicola]|nr:hypothetical protein BDZ97DRAFT_1918961 [Flammula alnicola]